MEFSFLLLIGSVAFVTLSAGASLAVLVLDPSVTALTGRGRGALGVPTLVALALVIGAVFVPAFDVDPPALIAAASGAVLAAIAGTRPGVGWAVGRLVLWIATAAAQAEALIQAVGIR